MYSLVENTQIYLYLFFSNFSYHAKADTRKNYSTNRGKR